MIENAIRGSILVRNPETKKESAVRMLSAVPAVLVNAIERVAPPSAVARTVFVVPKSKPSA